MARHFSRWTPEQEKLAGELMAAGTPPEQFLVKLGRTKDAAYQRLYYKRVGPYRPKAERLRPISAQTFQIGDQVSARPDEKLLAEAEARANVPRTATAWLCGDPPPGYSALDKRHYG
jgi:hypothetical protein